MFADSFLDNRAEFVMLFGHQLHLCVATRSRADDQYESAALAAPTTA